jgi:hypothetical protein
MNRYSTNSVFRKAVTHLFWLQGRHRKHRPKPQAGGYAPEQRTDHDVVMFSSSRIVLGRATALRQLHYRA